MIVRKECYEENIYIELCCDYYFNYLHDYFYNWNNNRSTAPVKQDRQRHQPEKTESTAIEEKNTYTFKITHGEDTRDGSELWVVRIEETLTKDEYIRINKAVKDLGGYYSKFKHGFIFRFEPPEALKKIAWSGGRAMNKIKDILQEILLYTLPSSQPLRWFCIGL